MTTDDRHEAAIDRDELVKLVYATVATMFATTLLHAANNPERARREMIRYRTEKKTDSWSNHRAIEGIE